MEPPYGVSIVWSSDPVPSLSLSGSTTPAQLRIVRVRSVVASGIICAGTRKHAWSARVALHSGLESTDRAVTPELALGCVPPSASLSMKTQQPVGGAFSFGRSEHQVRVLRYKRL